MNTLSSYLQTFYRDAPAYYPSEMAVTMGDRAEQFLQDVDSNAIKASRWWLRHNHELSTIAKYRFAPLLDENLQLLTIKDQEGRMLPNLDVIMFKGGQGAFASRYPAAILRPILMWDSNKREFVKMKTIHKFKDKGKDWISLPLPGERKDTLSPELFYAQALRDIFRQNELVLGNDVVGQKQLVQALEAMYHTAKKMPDRVPQAEIDILEGQLMSAATDKSLVGGNPHVEQPRLKLPHTPDPSSKPNC